MKGQDARGFCRWYLDFDIGLKFARSDFGKPGFFNSGEISASLNLDGKVAWVEERFCQV